MRYTVAYGASLCYCPQGLDSTYPLLVPRSLGARLHREGGRCEQTRSRALQPSDVGVLGGACGNRQETA